MLVVKKNRNERRGTALAGKCMFAIYVLAIFFGASLSRGETPIAPLSAAKGFATMAPLLIGDPNNMESDFSRAEWVKFERQLRRAKDRGARTVSFDVWWGLIEKEPGKFDFRYYDKILQVIDRVGMKANPIDSAHQLGGNVGDKGFLPIPKWVWSLPVKNTPLAAGNADSSPLMFKSEQGNLNKESISVWGTDFVLPFHKRRMTAIRDRFAPYARIISEITVSLGPAGEMRYPSYNGHDQNAGFPTRGSLQAYSDLAVMSFRQAMQRKYRSLENLRKAWGFSLQSFDAVNPPNPELLKSGAFFGRGEHFSAYGKDFFDWYNQSLVDHGRKMLAVAADVFGAPNSALRNASIAGKIPGVHWLAGSSRLAELAAGLIRTSYQDWYSDNSGFGYQHTLGAFVSGPGQKKWKAHFTAIEMNDREYQDGVKVASLARTLTFKVLKAAKRLNIPLGGENALSGELNDPHAWTNIKDALKAGYEEVTLLRLNEIADDPHREGLLWDLTHTFARAPLCRALFAR